MRRDHIENRLYKTLNKYLQKNGFDTPNKTQYYNESDNCIDFIQFRVVEIGQDFGVIYSISRTYELIERYWLDLRTKANPNWTGEERTIIIYRTTIDLGLEDTSKSHLLKNGGIYLKTSDIDNEIEKFKNTFIDEYENLICPFLKQTENIHWMDKKLNTNPMDFDEPTRYFPFIGLIYKKVIVARLAGNPNYEKIYEEFSDRYSTLLKETEDEELKNQYEVLKLVYKRLKDVTPLDNPILV